jgi:hypothetical protein
MNESYNLARAIFGNKIESLRDDVEAAYMEASEAVEELSTAIYYCDAFSYLDSIKAAELAELIITE